MSLCKQPKIQHCILKWRVEHFRIQIQASRYIESPHFPWRTNFLMKWKMSLEVDEYTCSTRHVSFYLERCNIPNGPPEISAKCLFYLQGGMCVNECEKVFKKADHWEVKNLEELQDILELDEVRKNDQITIYCEIIINDNLNSFQDEATDEALISLSSDLQAVYEQSKFCDCTFRMFTKTINMHQAMLVARTSGYTSLLKCAELTYINISNLKFEAVKKIISYLYSGDLNMLLNKPAFGLLDCTEKFQVNELRCVFTTDNVNAITTVDSEMIRYKWVFETINSFLKCADECIQSPILNEGTQKGSLWQLKFYPRGIPGYKDFSGISGNIIKGSRKCFVRFQAMVVDDNEKCLIFKETSLLEDGKCTVPNFIPKSFYDNDYVLNNNRLQLSCCIEYSSGKRKQILTCQDVSIRTGSSAISLRSKLAEDLEDLYESQILADISLIVNDKVFLLHRFILAARSPYFSKLLSGNVNTRFEIPNLDADIFEIIVKYMYSGKLSSMQPSARNKVYAAAKRFDMAHLQTECSRRLEADVMEDVSNSNYIQ